MNEILASLSKNMQLAASQFLVLAYTLGRNKAAKKYGILPWGEIDNVNIAMLINRHAQELAASMAALELRASQGEPLKDLLDGLIHRVGSWSWVLSPALALGLAAYVDTARRDIATQIQVETVPPGKPPISGAVGVLPAANDIGIIWYTAEDKRVCPKCLYLAGRWFDAKQAYDLARSIHIGCRCSAFFDIGMPDEALVGPIPGYKPGTAQDVYRDLHVDGLASARTRRARSIIEKGKPKEYARA
jgi:hypothetical protein